MNVVQNSVAVRAKTMRHLGQGVYEYGWLVYQQSNRKVSKFTRSGTGTMEQAQAWMASSAVGTTRRVFRSITHRGTHAT